MGRVLGRWGVRCVGVRRGRGVLGVGVWRIAVRSELLCFFQVFVCLGREFLADGGGV